MQQLHTLGHTFFWIKSELLIFKLLAFNSGGLYTLSPFPGACCLFSHSYTHRHWHTQAHRHTVTFRNLWPGRQSSFINFWVWVQYSVFLGLTSASDHKCWNAGRTSRPAGTNMSSSVWVSESERERERVGESAHRQSKSLERPRQPNSPKHKHQRGGREIAKHQLWKVTKYPYSSNLWSKSNCMSEWIWLQDRLPWQGSITCKFEYEVVVVAPIAREKIFT